MITVHFDRTRPGHTVASVTVPDPDNGTDVVVVGPAAAGDTGAALELIRLLAEMLIEHIHGARELASVIGDLHAEIREKEEI